MTSSGSPDQIARSATASDPIGHRPDDPGWANSHRLQRRDRVQVLLDRQRGLMDEEVDPHHRMVGGDGDGHPVNSASVPWSMTRSQPNSLAIRIAVAVSSARWQRRRQGISRHNTQLSASSLRSRSTTVRSEESFSAAARRPEPARAARS
jgi:hypothetical protein